MVNLYTPSSPSSSPDASRSTLTDWESWRWWIGCVLGSLLGASVLVGVRLRMAGRWGEVPLGECLQAAAMIAGVQVGSLLLAFLVWKCCCAPRRPAARAGF